MGNDQIHLNSSTFLKILVDFLEDTRRNGIMTSFHFDWKKIIKTKERKDDID
jgi:hypothetical protein